MNHEAEQERALKSIRGSLGTLKALAASFDEGNYDAARDMANIAHRLLVEEMVQAGIRRKWEFLNFAFDPNPRNLLWQLLTTVADVHFQYAGEGEPTFTITHKPKLNAITGGYPQRFNDWWNGPTLIQGSSEDHRIDLNEKWQIPYEKRAKFSRREIIEVFRNARGAHHDRNLGLREQLIEDHVIRALDISARSDTGEVFSEASHPHCFNYSNTRGQAIVRHVAYEILESSRAWPL